MISQHGSYGEHGPFIVFKLEGTTDVLWRCAMPYVPAANDLVGRIEDGESEVTTWHKVEEVRFEFYHEVGDYLDSGGGSVPFTAPSDNVGVCVYVSVVV